MYLNLWTNSETCDVTVVPKCLIWQYIKNVHVIRWSSWFRTKKFIFFPLIYAFIKDTSTVRFFTSHWHLFFNQFSFYRLKILPVFIKALVLVDTSDQVVLTSKVQENLEFMIVSCCIHAYQSIWVAKWGLYWFNAETVTVLALLHCSTNGTEILGPRHSNHKFFGHSIGRNPFVFQTLSERPKKE